MLENSIFLFESFPTGHALLFEPWVWINGIIRNIPLQCSTSNSKRRDTERNTERKRTAIE